MVRVDCVADDRGVDGALRVIVQDGVAIHLEQLMERRLDGLPDRLEQCSPPMFVTKLCDGQARRLRGGGHWNGWGNRNGGCGGFKQGC